MSSNDLELDMIPGSFHLHKRTKFYTNPEKRTSSLYAPKERLEDHINEVLACKFHPSGKIILSAGRDKIIRICRVYDDEGNVMEMKGHTGPVMEVNFSTDGSHFYTCSGDKTIGNWDTCIGLRIDRLEGHGAYVNSVQNAPRSSILCSGSDDGTVGMWDTRTDGCITRLEAGHRVFSTVFDEDGDRIMSAGASSNITIYDIRKNEAVLTLSGHTAPITGLALSSCGSYLLSNSLDNTARIWDILPVPSEGRLVWQFPLNQNIPQRNLLRCAWAKTDNKVSVGSGNHDEVHIWDFDSEEVICKVLGHTDSVNDVAFHPYEQIVMTASTDKCIYLTEIDY